MLVRAAGGCGGYAPADLRLTLSLGDIEGKHRDDSRLDEAAVIQNEIYGDGVPDELSGRISDSDHEVTRHS